MDRRQALAIGVGLLGCAQGRRVRVGAKNFVEQDILGAILAEAIRRQADLEVDLRLRLGGSLIAHQAIVAGQLDLYPEYSGTALTANLKLPLPSRPEEVNELVRRTYAERHQIVWGWPLGFANTFAMVVRLQKQEVKSLSEATKTKETWKLGVGYEFEQRPDGWPAFRKVYPLALKGPLATMDLGLLYRALEAGEVDMIAANSTDPQLASGRFRVLEDDRKFFPPYEACVAVRQAALDGNDGLGQALTAVEGRIGVGEMIRMNAAVVLEKRSAESVAQEFVASLLEARQRSN